MIIKRLIHHFFVPSENNNFQAKALHLDFLSVYLILAMVFSFLYKTSIFSNILGYATDITIEKLYQLTNEERVKNGLNPLSYNEKLAKAAMEKAKDMFAKNYWAHYAPDGTTPWDFILASGYRYEYAGENLAKNFLFSDGVVKAWMNSPTHKENILKPEYQEIGFAVVNGVLNGEETTLVVQMFGKPLSDNLAINQQKNNSQITENNLTTPTPALIAGVIEKTIPQTYAIEKTKKPIINIKTFSFNYSLILFVFLLMALVSDLYFAYRLKVVRISGKHLFHFIFLTIIIVIIISATKGAIL